MIKICTHRLLNLFTIGLGVLALKSETTTDDRQTWFQKRTFLDLTLNGYNRKKNRERRFFDLTQYFLFITYL